MISIIAASIIVTERAQNDRKAARVRVRSVYSVYKINRKDVIDDDDITII